MGHIEIFLEYCLVLSMQRNKENELVSLRLHVSIALERHLGINIHGKGLPELSPDPHRAVQCL